MAAGDNGLNPVWRESVVFDVDNPELAFVRFVVNEEDSFGDANFLAQAVYPLRCLRQGFRSVILSNAFSEQLELASLLIHLSIKNAKVCLDVPSQLNLSTCVDVFSSAHVLHSVSRSLDPPAAATLADVHNDKRTESCVVALTPVAFKNNNHSDHSILNYPLKTNKQYMELLKGLSFSLSNFNEMSLIFM